MSVVTRTAIQDIRDAIAEKKDILTVSVSIDDISGGTTNIDIVPTLAYDKKTRLKIRPSGDIEAYLIEGSSEYLPHPLVSIKFGGDGMLTIVKDGVVMDKTEYTRPLTGRQLVDIIINGFEDKIDYLDNLNVKGE